MIKNLFDDYPVTFTVVVIIAIITITTGLTLTFNDHTIVGEITDKTPPSATSGTYLVFVKDADGNFHEFCNKDEWFRGKTKASNLQNQLEIGSTYEFTVIGMRWGLPSWYENIIGFNLVDDGNGNTEIQPPVTAAAEWACSCGAENKGNFCSNCGSPRND